jgi:hypothetical protein
VEKEERAWGFWPKGHLLPPSLDSEQRGRNEPSGGRPRGSGGPVHGGGRGMGQNGEEAEGVRFPFSPWVGAARGGGSTGGGGLEVSGGTIGGSGGARERGESSVVRWGMTRRFGAICRRLKAVRGRGKYLSGDRRRFGREGPRRPVPGEVTARAEGPWSSAAAVGSCRVRCGEFRGGGGVDRQWRWWR